MKQHLSHPRNLFLLQMFDVFFFFFFILNGFGLKKLCCSQLPVGVDLLRQKRAVDTLVMVQTSNLKSEVEFLP